MWDFEDKSLINAYLWKYLKKKCSLEVTTLLQIFSKSVDHLKHMFKSPEKQSTYSRVTPFISWPSDPDRSTLSLLLSLMLLLASFTSTKLCKKAEKLPSPGKRVLIWGYSARAFQWIPTRQGLEGFQKYLRTCASDENKPQHWKGYMHHPL